MISVTPSAPLAGAKESEKFLIIKDLFLTKIDVLERVYHFFYKRAIHLWRQTDRKKKTDRKMTTQHLHPHGSKIGNPLPYIVDFGHPRCHIRSHDTPQPRISFLSKTVVWYTFIQTLSKGLWNEFLPTEKLNYSKSPFLYPLKRLDFFLGVKKNNIGFECVYKNQN